MPTLLIVVQYSAATLYLYAYSFFYDSFFYYLTCIGTYIATIYLYPQYVFALFVSMYILLLAFACARIRLDCSSVERKIINRTFNYC